MDDLIGQGIPASAVRAAFLLQKRLGALSSGTARSYLEYQALRASLELFKPAAVVPWVSYLFPTELLASFGLTPLIPEVAAATLTATDLRVQLERAAGRLPLARDVCSYHRTALAALEEGLLPAPSLCLGTTPLCLGKERLLDTLAERHEVPFCEIRVPLPPDEGAASADSVNEVAEQLRHLHGFLQAYTGRQPRLARAVELSNRAAVAWRFITDQRLSGSLALNGCRTFSLTFLGQIAWGTPAGAKGFEKLLSERGRRDLSVPLAGRPGAARLRLLWLHTMPHHDSALFECMAAKDAAVIFEEMGQTHLEPLDPLDPFSGLARRLLDHPLWGSSRRRARLVSDLAQRLRAHGVIHFNHWGCRHGAGSVPVLRDALSRAGIPFLAIDGDALASDGSSKDGSLGQLEAFLEMV